MNNNKYFDFDEYMAERSGDPFIIKAFGEENEIPNDVPFDVVLKISRAMKEGQQTMSEEATLDMANTIFGKDTFTKWLEKGIGISGIMILTEKVMEMYMTNASSLSKKMADQKRTDHPNP